jgi:hypothetical protein
MLRKVVLTAVILASIAVADTVYVEVGSPAVRTDFPFGDFGATRCQLLYRRYELNHVGRISAIDFWGETWNDDTARFSNLRVKLCPTTADTLDTTFIDNYRGNTPVTVLDTPSFQFFTHGQTRWEHMVLAEPFFYYNTDNLLVEVLWRYSNSGEFVTYQIPFDHNRMVWQGNDSARSGQNLFSPLYIRLGFTPIYQGRLLDPNGGQYWAGGDIHAVNWTVGPRDYSYGQLLLSTDGGSTFPTVIAPSLDPAETTFSWAIPEYNSANCRVKLQAFDTSATLIFETASDSDFTIDSQDPAAPSLIYPLQQGATNDTSVVFRWHRASDNLSGIAYHTIQIAHDSLFVAEIDTARSAETTFARVLPADTSYYWRVRATDKCGNVGPWSTGWEFEVDTLVPGVPTLLAPVGGQWLQSSFVGFQWTPVTFGSGLSAVRYVLQLDTTALFSHPRTDTLSVPFDTVNFLAESHYWWRVRAFDLGGNQGAFSSVEAFGLDTSSPAIPSTIYPPHLSLIWTDTTSIIWHVARDNLSGTELYHLQLARDSAFADTVAGFAPAAGDTHRHAGVPDTIDYYWRVRARDLAGNWSNWCPTRVFTRLMTSIRAERGAPPGAFDVACNPSLFARETEFRIRLPERAPVRAEIYNSAGRRVNVVWAGTMPAGTNCIRWQGTTAQGDRAKSGFYLLRVTALGKTQTRALILVDN